MRVSSAFTGIAVALAASVAILAAQSPQQTLPSAQRPEFRSGVNIVPIDVRVIDQSGKPITDLKQEDFTILEDNVPQVIRAFSTQAYTAQPVVSGTAPPVRSSQFDEAASVNRRTFLIVMGRGRHQDASKYVDAMANFVGSRVLPQDYVAVMAWNRATDFTTDHEVIRRTLIKFRDEHAKIEAALIQWFSGLRGLYGSTEIPDFIQKMIDGVFAEAMALRPRPLAPAPVIDAKRTNDDIKRTAHDLQRNAELNDRRAAGFKTLPDVGAELTAGFNDLSFDEYIERTTETMQDVGNLYAAIGYLRFLAGEKHLVFVTSNGISLPRQEGNASLARVAASARISLDLIHTAGFVGPPPPRFLPGGGLQVTPMPTSGQIFTQTFMIQDLRMMADRTGGQLMAFRSGEDAVRRIDEALAFQYLLGYTPANSSWDGKFRKVVVKVNRPGARVLAREGYVAAEAPVALDRREMITFNRLRAAAEYTKVIDHLKIALGAPTVVGTTLSVDVTVDVAKLRFADQDGRKTVALDAVLYVGDEREKPIGEHQQRVELRLSEASFARAQQGGTTFRLTAPVTGTARRIKVIVYDYGADLVGSAIAQVK